MPPRLKKPPPGEEIRLARDIDTLKRMALAIRTGVPQAQRRAFVFNDAELRCLERMAKGEAVPEVVLMADVDRRRWAREYLAWPYRCTDEDGA
jgi:hypothetical protein